MALRNPVQIAQHAWSAGFRGPDLIRAVATAMAESSGRTDANNPTSTATGLWQIMQGVHVKSHPEWTVSWLENPDNNAKAAYTLWKESGWRPWDASKAGAVLYTPAASTAVNTFLAMNPTAIPKNIGDTASGFVDRSTGLGDIKQSAAQGVDALSKAGKWLGTASNWIRALEVIAGAGMVLLGLAALAFPAADKVVGLAPSGKVVNAVKKVAK